MAGQVRVFDAGIYKLTEMEKVKYAQRALNIVPHFALFEKNFKELKYIEEEILRAPWSLSDKKDGRKGLTQVLLQRKSK